MTRVTLQGLAKRYGATVAVDSVELAIESGELFFLLGPSGCGKTTVLRMIAGFVEPTSGRILFGDRDVTALPANRRETGMVFQSYALWPHLTVAENVAYGLAVRRVKRVERVERVGRALDMVKMSAYAERRPNQLSGGQQQRVALARALVIEPSVLLLDEPLSNLDAKMRLEMRSEIDRICRAARITTIYVTHDQKEALSLADRVAVLRDGRVEQVGPPRELYDRPRSRFVADFLGETNLLEATIDGRERGRVRLAIAGGGALDADEIPGAAAPAHGARVTCSVRPESLRVARGAGGANGARLSGRLRESVYLGEVAQHHVELPGGQIVKSLELDPGPFAPTGSTVELTAEPAKVVILEKGV